MGIIRRITEREVYTSTFGTLFDDEVAWPSGRHGSHLRLRMGDGRLGVVVVPRHAGLLGLVRTYRYAIAAEQWAFPRGSAQHSDPLETARAELHEEMGLTAELTVLGCFTPDSGVQDSRVAVVLAEVDHREGTIQDTDEVAAVTWVSPARLRELLGRTGWDDGMTMAALTLLDAASG